MYISLTDHEKSGIVHFALFHWKWAEQVIKCGWLTDGRVWLNLITAISVCRCNSFKTKLNINSIQFNYIYVLSHDYSRFAWYSGLNHILGNFIKINFRLTIIKLCDHKTRSWLFALEKGVMRRKWGLWTEYLSNYDIVVNWIYSKQTHKHTHMFTYMYTVFMIHGMFCLFIFTIVLIVINNNLKYLFSLNEDFFKSFLLKFT